DLERQDLDFKEWIQRSFDDNIKLMIKMAVCMANGGGGSIVFGVADKKTRKSEVIKGVPLTLDLYAIAKRIYERTDPHLMPHLEEIDVPYGTGKILIMHVLPGIPPYTTTDGSATIRQGKDCIPFTGTLRRQMVSSSAEHDFTAEVIYEDWKQLFSPTAMERIREILVEQRASETLQNMSDEDLLVSVGALKNGYLTNGALLLVGKPEAIKRILPQYSWGYRKMLSDTDYMIKEDGSQAIPVALYELERYIASDNPLVTIQSGLIHPEFHTYPTLALRESLLNAFGHRDYRLLGSVMLKQYKDKLVITNPGEFIGGIKPNNILHHPSVTRNSHLMDLLDKLKFVNRSNLGVPRIYRSLLIEGKEPPVYREIGNHIELTFIASPLNGGFKNFVNDMSAKGFHLDTDHLLILQYLLRHSEIDNAMAAEIIQRNQEQTREVLSKLTIEMKLLEAIGRGRGRYYTLSKKAFELLKEDMAYERQTILDDEAIKMRILTILKERPLRNKDIRTMTGYDQKQVQRLMKSLSDQGVKVTGRGAGAKYILGME
ncbi:transcriptional regulator, partial [Bacillus cereus]